MNPIGKDIHEGKIIEYIGKNLIYAKDRVIGRANRQKRQESNDSQEEQGLELSTIEEND